MQNTDLDDPAPATARILRPRGRPSNDAAGVVREDTVLDRAFYTFAQRGYEGTTLRELAKELGVSHNLINVRFGSKADLWRRAVDAHIARVAPPVMAAFDEPGMDDKTRLAELIRRLCRWTAENPDFVGLMHTEGRRATWRLDYLANAYAMPFKEKLSALLASIASQRPVRDISASALMAVLVEGVGFYFASGPLLNRMGDADEISPDKMDGQIDIFAEFILAGLLP